MALRHVVGVPSNLLAPICRIKLWDQKTLMKLYRPAIARAHAGGSLVTVAMGVNLRTVFRWLVLYRKRGGGA